MRRMLSRSWYASSVSAVRFRKRARCLGVRLARYACTKAEISSNPAEGSGKSPSTRPPHTFCGEAQHSIRERLINVAVGG